MAATICFNETDHQKRGESSHKQVRVLVLFSLSLSAFRPYQFRASQFRAMRIVEKKSAPEACVPKVKMGRYGQWRNFHYYIGVFFWVNCV